MANWTAFLDTPVSVEPPNAVAYINWISDDAEPRILTRERVPYADESGLLNYLARRAKQLSEMDTRNAQMAVVVANATISPGMLRLPDITKVSVIDFARATLIEKVSAALLQDGTPLTKDQIAAAVAIDPTVNDALTAFVDAQK